MLYAFKHNLTAQTALLILGVRERELQFYTRNILNIGAQAALLAGFAFKTLSSHFSSNVLEWMSQSDDEFVKVWIYTLDARQAFMTIIELIYLISTISAMGLTLFTLYICLITPILSTGLALRGPEGAVDRAVISLASVNASVIKSFAYALNLFQLSVLMKAFLTFNLVAAIICAFFTSYYYFKIWHSTRRVIRTFKIAPNQIVTGRFDNYSGSSRFGRSLASMKRSQSSSSLMKALHLSGPPVALAGDSRTSDKGAKSRSLSKLYNYDPYTTERYAEKHGGAKIDHDAMKPNNVTKQMMYRIQGSLPPTKPDKVL